MALRKILTEGDEQLLKHSRKVLRFTITEDFC